LCQTSLSSAAFGDRLDISLKAHKTGYPGKERGFPETTNLGRNGEIMKNKTVF
jgi:hypothetical protein